MSGVPNGGGLDKWFEAAATVFLALLCVVAAAVTTYGAYLIGQWTGVIVLWMGVAAFMLATSEVRKRL